MWVYASKYHYILLHFSGLLWTDISRMNQSGYFCRSWRRQRVIRCCVTPLVVILFIASYIYIKYIPEVQYVYLNKNLKEPCVLPNIDPYDPEIKKYVWSPDPIFCERKEMFVYFDEKSMVNINETVIKSLGLTHVVCSYSIIKYERGLRCWIYPGSDVW